MDPPRSGGGDSLPLPTPWSQGQGKQSDWETKATTKFTPQSSSVKVKVKDNYDPLSLATADPEVRDLVNALQDCGISVRLEPHLLKHERQSLEKKCPCQEAGGSHAHCVDQTKGQGRMPSAGLNSQDKGLYCKNLI
jgi:hypothetical protein